MIFMAAFPIIIEAFEQSKSVIQSAPSSLRLTSSKKEL